MVMRLRIGGHERRASRAPSCRSRRITASTPGWRRVSTQSTIARPLALSSGKVRELVIHSRPVGLAAIDHVGGEVGEQEEQGRAEQALEHPEPAAEHAVDRPEHRAPRLAADRAGEQFDRDIGRQEQQREGQHRSPPPRSRRCRPAAPAAACGTASARRSPRPRRTATALHARSRARSRPARRRRAAG